MRFLRGGGLPSLDHERLPDTDAPLYRALFSFQTPQDGFDRGCPSGPLQVTRSTGPRAGTLHSATAAANYCASQGYGLDRPMFSSSTARRRAAGSGLLSRIADPRAVGLTDPPAQRDRHCTRTSVRATPPHPATAVPTAPSNTSPSGTPLSVPVAAAHPATDRRLGRASSATLAKVPGPRLSEEKAIHSPSLTPYAPARPACATSGVQALVPRPPLAAR